MKTSVLLENINGSLVNLENFYSGYIIFFEKFFIFSKDKKIEGLINILPKNSTYKEIKGSLKNIFSKEENIIEKQIFIMRKKALKVYDLEAEKQKSLNNYDELTLIPCSLYIEKQKSLKIGSVILFFIYFLCTYLGNEIIDKNQYLFEVIDKNNLYILYFLIIFLSVIGIGLIYVKIFETYVQRKMIKALKNIELSN